MIDTEKKEVSFDEIRFREVDSLNGTVRLEFFKEGKHVFTDYVYEYKKGQELSCSGFEAVVKNKLV